MNEPMLTMEERKAINKGRCFGGSHLPCATTYSDAPASRTFVDMPVTHGC